jgi:hypothetical protein
MADHADLGLVSMQARSSPRLQEVVIDHRRRDQRDQSNYDGWPWHEPLVAVVADEGCSYTREMVGGLAEHTGQTESGPYEFIFLPATLLSRGNPFEQEVENLGECFAKASRTERRAKEAFLDLGLGLSEDDSESLRLEHTGYFMAKPESRPPLDELSIPARGYVEGIAAADVAAAGCRQVGDCDEYHTRWVEGWTMGD